MSTPASVEAGPPGQPPKDCPLCPRLVGFRNDNREKHPAYFNGAVPNFGETDAQLLIVGLAPGLHGANKTGRPFTGDYAGELLYRTLRAQNLAQGDYRASADDGFVLIGCAITNAVRCVPPENKPLPVEINTCRKFLVSQIARMHRLKAVLALGRIARDSVIAALALPKKAYLFSHGAVHRADNLTIIASYHCSRYNTNTRVLTEEMFASAVAVAKKAAGL